MPKLADKVAIVTGAARGLGREMALTLADNGARVIVSDVIEDEGQEVAAACRERGVEAVFKVADVSREDQVEALVKAAVENFGCLDLACNNAGIEGPICNTADLEMEDWQRVLGINLTGVWLCMKYEIRQFQAQGGGGAIVNTASIMGHIANPGIPAYNAAKHGVLGLTKTAALEYAKENIRVNAVCPGGIRTTIIERTEQSHPENIAGLIAATPMGRLGQPADIARAALWLLSDDAAYVTGQSMIVDGGYTCQ